MREYLKYRIWDWIFCSGIAVGLVFPLFAGFVLDDAFSSSVPLVTVFMFAVMALLLFFSRSRITVIVGIVCGVALLLFVMVYVRVNDVFGGQGQEASNSLFVAMVVASVTAVLVYLAGRSRPGILAMFLIGTIVICGSYFLMFEVHTWSLLLFLFCVFLLYWYRNYLCSLDQAQAGKIRLPRFMVQSILLCLAALVIGGGAWYGIVRPLSPPTRELKLIQDLKQMNIVRQTGLYSTQEYLDPNQQSARDADQDMDGTQEKEEDGDQQGDAAAEGAQDTEQDQQQDAPQKKQDAQAVYYLLHWRKIPWKIIVAAMVVAGAFALRYLGKKNWESVIQKMTPEEQIRQVYTYILLRLERIGMKRPDGYTLYEYAADLEDRLERFAVEEADFTKLTEIYVSVFYGGNEAAPEAVQLFWRFYGNFHRALRKEIGNFRYLINIFRI